MIIEITPLPTEDVERSLLGLLCTGVVEYDRQVRPVPPPPAPAPQGSEDVPGAVEQVLEGLETKDHFEILGLTRSANDGEVKQAYAQLAKRFHPDAHPGASAELAARIQRAFVRVTEAYRFLTSPEGRAQRADAPKVNPPPGSEAPPRPTTAPDAVAAAENEVAEGRPWAAPGILEPFLPEMEGALERRARSLLARVYLMHPDSARKAEAEYLRVMQIDANDVEAPLALGKFYEQRGLVARARAMFEKVLRLQPAHRAARAALASLGSTSENSGPASFLGKLRRH
jgi:tetratricopeptide (TPR) repeat protein